MFEKPLSPPRYPPPSHSHSHPLTHPLSSSHSHSHNHSGPYMTDAPYMTDHSTRSGPTPPYMNDDTDNMNDPNDTNNNNNMDRYNSYTRSNIFNNDHESEDDSIPMQTPPHMLPPHSLPQLQFDTLPHTKLQSIQLPHEHSYTPNFPPLSQSYRQYHYPDNSKIIDNDTSTFIFDRQSPHKKLPVQLPPLFPPPPQLPPNFPHDRPFKQSVFNNSR